MKPTADEEETSLAVPDFPKLQEFSCSMAVSSKFIEQLIQFAPMLKTLDISHTSMAGEDWPIHIQSQSLLELRVESFDSKVV